MYPLNLIRPSKDIMRMPVGFAVANDEAEHAALSDAGYEPRLEVDLAEADDAGHTVESVRAALDAAGIEYSKKLGLAKLVALLPA